MPGESGGADNCGCCGEQPETKKVFTNVVPKAAKRISQETFDEVVQENIDDFEMDIDEALADARQQFVEQKVDLDNIVTGRAAWESMGKLREVCEKLELELQARKTEKEGGPDLLAFFLQIKQMCEAEADLRKVAVRHGCIGAGCFAAKTFGLNESPSNDHTMREACNLLALLMKEEQIHRESLPMLGLQALMDLLRARTNAAAEGAMETQTSSGVMVATLRAILSSITENEANKKRLHEAKGNDLMVLLMTRFSGRVDPPGKAVFSTVCKVVRKYVTDDDRRPGVQPGTFGRARELAEKKNEGLLNPLFAAFGSHATEKSLKLQMAVPLQASEKAPAAPSITPDENAPENKTADNKTKTGLREMDVGFVNNLVSTLQALAVNDTICKHITKSGTVELSMQLFARHVEKVQLARNVCQLLKTVCRNDQTKKLVGQGSGLPLIVHVIEAHMEEPRVVEQCVATLSTMTLRQPEICMRIGELGCIPLLAQVMDKYPMEAGIQRPAMTTWRNMVSSWKTKDLVQPILDQNAEKLIREAMKNHPDICNDAGFAALRDLGLNYTATWAGYTD